MKKSEKKIVSEEQSLEQEDTLFEEAGDESWNSDLEDVDLDDTNSESEEDLDSEYIGGDDLDAGYGNEVEDDSEGEMFDFNKVEASKSKSVGRVGSDPGAMSIICSKNNGKRITLAGETMDKLKNPQTLQFGFTDDSVVISEDIPENDNYLNIRASGKKGIIYSSQLVEEIIKRFGLEFEGITSKTFGEVQYFDDHKHSVAAVIKIV